MASTLDEEIEDLQTKVSSLRKQIRIHTSTLITAPSTRLLLTEEEPATPSLTLPRADNDKSGSGISDSSIKQKLVFQSALQQAHNQQCLYRACASITTFRVRDPDPHAVDGGAILGLRIEVVSRAKFLRPYYVLLNRPYPGPGGSRHLRVHRHTLPPCIPLAGLAGRYLPAPTVGAEKSGSSGRQDGDAGATRAPQKQDLARFARALRREVVRYHHRLGIIADLKKAAGLGRTSSGLGESSERQRQPAALVDISPADAEAKQLTIEWADGRTGRLVMGDDGEILKLVVVGENGRDREAGRDLLGGAVRVEDVVKRLAAFV
ncbi:Cenp-O kinetochore centromere component-domain-containing protein [Chaetomium strumarium]|uniref:Cenp-O kinetochore centromere component-domain-containing protein n=1 Tax=Chaetomium strumarium TaxID=1170767 RepID=A0AAJ0H424_9PEZI|nr:Cenp-O kinetochore centromere component-domain-containing protein [Chaetomium strumarium]